MHFDVPLNEAKGCIFCCIFIVNFVINQILQLVNLAVGGPLICKTIVYFCVNSLVFVCLCMVLYMILVTVLHFGVKRYFSSVRSYFLYELNT